MPDHTQTTGAGPLLAIEAAIDRLRRGMPVRVAGNPGLAVIAVETADDASVAALRRLSDVPPVLLLSPARAASLGFAADDAGGAVAFDAAGLELPRLLALADPTMPAADAPSQAERPAGHDAAIGLAVLARLLPALLAVPIAGLSGISAGDVRDYARLASTALVRVSEASVPLEDAGDARLVAFRSSGSADTNYAVLVGRPEDAASPLVRVHSECFTGDFLGSLRCDCGSQLRGAIARMAAEGAGALLYLAQEGRGIGLANKLRAYTLQDRGLDTLDANLALGFAADERDFQIAAAMLRQLGLTRVRLLTNNPDKLATLAAHGIEVTGRASLLFAGNGVNDRYLQTKAGRFGHLFG